jgi:hypothetical protein
MDGIGLGGGSLNCKLLHVSCQDPILQKQHLRSTFIPVVLPRIHVMILRSHKMWKFGESSGLSGCIYPIEAGCRLWSGMQKSVIGQGWSPHLPVRLGLGPSSHRDSNTPDLN